MSQDTYHESLYDLIDNELFALDSLARTAEQILIGGFEKLEPSAVPALAMLITRTTDDARATILRAMDLAINEIRDI